MKYEILVIGFLFAACAPEETSDVSSQEELAHEKAVGVPGVKTCSVNEAEPIPGMVVRYITKLFPEGTCVQTGDHLVCGDYDTEIKSPGVFRDVDISLTVGGVRPEILLDDNLTGIGYCFQGRPYFKLLTSSYGETK